MNSGYFWWFLDIYRTSEVANRLHTWNAVPFVAFESIKQIPTRAVHSPQSVPVCLCKMFSIFDHCLVTHPRPIMECGPGRGRGRLPEISISRKSALLSRHNSMGFICVCHFVVVVVVAQLLLLLLLFFISIFLSPSCRSQVFFYSCQPRGQSCCRCWSTASRGGSAYACVGSLGPQITSFWIIMENIKWMSRPFIFITKLCSLQQIYYTQLEHFALFVRY